MLFILGRGTIHNTPSPITFFFLGGGGMGGIDTLKDNAETPPVDP